MSKHAYLFIQKNLSSQYPVLNNLCAESECGLLFSKFNDAENIANDILGISEKIVNKNAIVINEHDTCSYINNEDGILTIIIRDSLDNEIDSIMECCEQEGAQVTVTCLCDPYDRPAPRINLPSHKSREETYVVGYYFTFGKGTVRTDQAKEFSLNEINKKGCLSGVPSSALCGDMFYYLGLTLKYGA